MLDDLPRRWSDMEKVEKFLLDDLIRDKRFNMKQFNENDGTKFELEKQENLYNLYYDDTLMYTYDENLDKHFVYERNGLFVPRTYKTRASYIHSLLVHHKRVEIFGGYS